MKLTPADAEALLVRLVKEKNHGGYGSYGYDIFLPHLVMGYLQNENTPVRNPTDPAARELIEAFWPIAWDLCRRGILRPGVNAYGAQAVDDGQGSGYSITPFGEQWLAMASQNDFLPTEPGRFGQMLAPYRLKFGNAFHERAQEAMRCYGAQAYLACCVMCGSAAEAILLTAAEAKIGEAKTLTEYKGAAGRSRIENALFGQSKFRQEAQPYLLLLNYWRTDGAHGKPSIIKENEAYTSLTLLLRFAIFVTENWDALTSKTVKF